MRHGKAGYKLGRTSSHRLATLRNLAAALLEHGQIVTTLPRAKAVQPWVEKLITTAKGGGLNNRRMVISRLGWDRHAFEWLYVAKNATANEKQSVEAVADRARKYFDIPKASEVERNRYGDLRSAPKLVKHIFDNVVPRFRDRAGGYTRIVKLGRHRIGDGGEQVILQFVGAEEGPEIGGNISTRRRIADKRTAFAAKVRKASAASASAAAASAPATSAPASASEPKPE